MARQRNDRDETDYRGENRYGEELLSANWNPVLELLPCADTHARASRSASRDVSDEDADAFLGRIYSFGA